MPTERMEEVEVVCRTCQGKWPQVCSGGCRGTGAETMGVFPGSLTSARLRLADAAEAERKAFEVWTQSGSPRIGDLLADWQAKRIDFEDALAALRTARGE